MKIKKRRPVSRPPFTLIVFLGSHMVLIEFFGCERNLDDGERNIMRITIPGILQCVEIDAVAVFAQIVQLNVAGIK